MKKTPLFWILITIIILAILTSCDETHYILPEGVVTSVSEGSFVARFQSCPKCNIYDYLGFYTDRPDTVHVGQIVKLK